MTPFQSPIVRRGRTILAAALLTASASAQLEPPGPPDDPVSAFFTLADIERRLAFGEVGSKRTGPFVEPTSGPATTGPTLDQIMALAPHPDAAAAVPNQCLAGRTYWSLDPGAWGPSGGTMPDRGARILVPGPSDQPILLGFHNGAGRVEGDGDLVPGNIRADPARSSPPTPPPLLAGSTVPPRSTRWTPIW